MEVKNGMNTVLEISDNGSFEVFNDNAIGKVRVLFTPDKDDESTNIKLMLKYPEFINLSNIIRSMSLNHFEELKSMLNNIIE